MSLVDNSDDDDKTANREAAGGPPDFSHVEFDAGDPDVVKVFYDVSAWNFEQRAELSEVLAEMSIPHVWDDDELVVPEELEPVLDAIFGALEAELGPFAVALEDGVDTTEFDLDEWPTADLEALREALVEAQIPHRWEGELLLVHVDDEERVDKLLDQIEAGNPNVDELEPPDEVLNTLFTAAGRLVSNPTASSGRETILEITPQLDPGVPPFGVETRPWKKIVDAATALYETFNSGSAEADDVEEQAETLRDACRQWV